MNAGHSPVILWFRRDLRLYDHAALMAACDSGRPVIPVFILDDRAANLGAAPKWRLGLALERFGETLKQKGSRLILRRGPAEKVLRDLIGETGAGAVFWTRLYDPDSLARDTDVKTTLRKREIEARSFPGHVMFEPWTAQTGKGGFFRVFTPFWNSVRRRSDDVELLPAPGKIPGPDVWPRSNHIDDWNMGQAMNRGADIVRGHVRPGEDAALARLDRFMDDRVEGYSDRRDYPADDATSGLSENLSLGEISPHRCWAAARRLADEGSAGAVTFQKQLVWREFAWHLMFHTPRMISGNWRENWDAFPWRTDHMASDVIAWKQGRTGLPFVDAGMRELYVTGRMHNRVRMIAASFLTKHLMCHWKIGMDWFADCLTDWDPASNAMGWQWVAGSGPDAAPYFRVFNPQTQAGRFDHGENYVRRWIAEGQINPPETALDYYRAVPLAWNLSPADPYPAPVIGLKEGRARALEAYGNRNFHDFPTT